MNCSIAWSPTGSAEHRGVEVIRRRAVMMAAGRRFMKVSFQVFKSHMKSWTNLCEEAAAFASEKGKERLINLSVSADSGQGIIVVWYWD
jgi:hypothetical protein